MSTREERILEVIRTRMATVPGVIRVELDPPDEHADEGPFPAIGIIPQATVPVQDGQRSQLVVQMPVTVRGITQAAAESPGLGDVPASARSTAYALFRQMLAALFPLPGAGIGTYHDRADGHALFLNYTGHELVPRGDGGKTYAVFIDCEAEYVLHLNDPSN